MICVGKRCAVTMKKWTFLFLLLQWMLMSVAHASLFYGGMSAWLAGNNYSSQGNYFTLEGNNNSWPSTALRLVIGADKKTLIGSTIVKSYIPTPCAYERLVMVRVTESEEVSVSSMQSATRYFQCVTVTNGAVAKIQSNYTIALSLWEDSTVYLGFLVEYANGAKSVGVISLDVSTDWIDVLNSVIDTDGEPVYGRMLGGFNMDGGTWQDDVYVDASQSSGNGYFWRWAWPSIQEAIWALRIQDSTIYVRPGVYGAISLTDIPCFELQGENHLVIESTAGPDSTFIDGGGYSVDDAGVVTGGVWCVSCGDETVFPHVTLRGFTLRNGLGGAKGVECLENCRVENCGYGFSNAYARACMFTNVRAPLAPGSGTRAKIAVTADGPRVTPLSSNLEGRISPMLFGTSTLTESNWSMTTNFSDAAFLRSNRFFTIGVVR